MKAGIIYKVTSPSSKVYIGQTVKILSARKSNHIYLAHNKKAACYNTKFYRAIRKYENNLIWEILYSGVPISHLSDKEINTIGLYDSYKNGYNSTIGGEGNAGYKHTDESKKKMSKSQKGRKHTEKTKKKMSKSRIGLRPTEKTKKKMSAARKGKKRKPLSKKHKAKLSEIWTEEKRQARSGAGNPFYGKKHSEDTRKKISEAGMNNSILNWTKVREIRLKYIPYKYAAPRLAKEYGVGRTTIHNIINNKTWIE